MPLMSIRRWDTRWSSFGVMIWISVFLHLLNVTVYGAIAGYLFKRTPFTVLTSSYEKVATSSAIYCCVMCKSDQVCTSVSYQNSTKSCVLSTVTYVSNDSQKSPDWDVYSIIDDIGMAFSVFYKFDMLLSV